MLARWIVSWVWWVVDFLFSGAVVEAEGFVDDGLVVLVGIVGWGVW